MLVNCPSKQYKFVKIPKALVGATGFEPVTSSL